MDPRDRRQSDVSCDCMMKAGGASVLQIGGVVDDAEDKGWDERGVVHRILMERGEQTTQRLSLEAPIQTMIM